MNRFPTSLTILLISFIFFSFKMASIRRSNSNLGLFHHMIQCRASVTRCWVSTDCLLHRPYSPNPHFAPRFLASVSRRSMRHSQSVAAAAADAAAAAADAAAANDNYSKVSPMVQVAVLGVSRITFDPLSEKLPCRCNRPAQDCVRVLR